MKVASLPIVLAAGMFHEIQTTMFLPAVRSFDYHGASCDGRGSNGSIFSGKSSDFQGASLATSQVVAGTCIGIASIKGIPDVEFDLCIVDVASKATPTETLVPLVRSRRWILVGDPKQLPPFFEGQILHAQSLEEFGLTLDDLRKTLFDRLE